MLHVVVLTIVKYTTVASSEMLMLSVGVSLDLALAYRNKNDKMKWCSWYIEWFSGVGLGQAVNVPLGATEQTI